MGHQFSRGRETRDAEKEKERQVRGTEPEIHCLVKDKVLCKANAGLSKSSPNTSDPLPMMQSYGSDQAIEGLGSGGKSERHPNYLATK